MFEIRDTCTARKAAAWCKCSAFRLCLLGLFLVVGGYFGPWVGHETAALTVTGFELAEFAKPMPATRELFFAPLIAAAILFGIVIHGAASRFVIRLAVTGIAVLLALAALPPYQFIREAQYRDQLILAAGGALLVLLTPLAHRLSRRTRSVLIALLALAGAIPALWQFARLRPLVVALYNAPPGLGWGLVVCSAGFALLLLSAILPNQEN